MAHPIDGNKFAVGQHCLNRGRLNDGQKAFKDLNVTFGSGFPSAWQHFPSNREADTFVSDSHHQNAGWGRSKVPFGSVENRYVWPLLRQKPHEKTPEIGKINVIAGEKTLDPSVVRLVFDTGFQRSGNLSEIGCRQLLQGKLKPGHQLQSGAVPSKVVAENVGDRLHVGRGDRLGFGADRSREVRAAQNAPLPSRKGTFGRKPKCHPAPLYRVDEVIAELPEKTWKTITWRSGRLPPTKPPSTKLPPITKQYRGPGPSPAAWGNGAHRAGHALRRSVWREGRLYQRGLGLHARLLKETPHRAGLHRLIQYPLESVRVGLALDPNDRFRGGKRRRRIGLVEADLHLNLPVVDVRVVGHFRPNC